VTAVLATRPLGVGPGPLGVKPESISGTRGSFPNLCAASQVGDEQFVRSICENEGESPNFVQVIGVNRPMLLLG
jgi:hypothetical protein